jgi:hypothetical protein
MSDLGFTAEDYIEKTFEYKKYGSEGWNRVEVNTNVFEGITLEGDEIQSGAIVNNEMVKTIKLTYCKDSIPSYTVYNCPNISVIYLHLTHNVSMGYYIIEQNAFVNVANEGVVFIKGYCTEDHLRRLSEYLPNGWTYQVIE